MMTLEETLRFLQGTAGVNFLIGAAWSYLVGLVPGLKEKFDSLSPEMKRLVIAAFSLLVPLGAFGLKLVLGYEFFSIDNTWKVLVAWAAAFFGSQVAHLVGPAHPDRLGSGGK